MGPISIVHEERLQVLRSGNFTLDVRMYPFIVLKWILEISGEELCA
jgi:hypothetical protein